MCLWTQVRLSLSPPWAKPPFSSLSFLVCSQDSSAGSDPAAEQQGVAPKVQLPLNV